MGKEVCVPPIRFNGLVNCLIEEIPYSKGTTTRGRSQGPKPLHKDGSSIRAGIYFMGDKETMTGKKKKILLIDDEEVILFGFKQVLSGPELHVDTASTVEETKKLLGNNSYAAAVVDLRLSSSEDLEGLELISFIKSTQKNCRVIVLTAYGEESVRRKTADAGADIFLEKPVDPDLIKKYLESLGIRG